MRVIEPHIHMIARTTADYERMAMMHTVACCEPGPAAHTQNGDLILTAAPGYWFAYPWWDDAREAPDYARHVDIHSKIGCDPCELFWGWPPPATSLDTTRVRGTHGRDDAPTCAGATAADLRGAPTLQALAARSRPGWGPDCRRGQPVILPGKALKRSLQASSSPGLAPRFVVTA